MTPEEKIKQLCSVLETAVDISSTPEVLEALATVCRAKAEHVAENWQDYNLAKAWLRTATLVETTADKVKGVLP